MIDVKIRTRRCRDTAAFRDNDPFVWERPRYITPQYIAETVEFRNLLIAVQEIVGRGAARRECCAPRLSWSPAARARHNHRKCWRSSCRQLLR